MEKGPVLGAKTIIISGNSQNHRKKEIKLLAKSPVKTPRKKRRYSTYRNDVVKVKGGNLSRRSCWDHLPQKTGWKFPARFIPL